MIRRAITGTVVAVVAIAGLAAWRLKAQTPVPISVTQSPPVPVIVAKVAVSDMPIVKVGIGTAVAYNSVAVHTQVTGTIEKIGFVEGQAVQPGSLIAQLDPRPFQAALQQAEANLARDQTHLTNAQANLARYVPLAKKGYATEQQVSDQTAAVAEQQSAIFSDNAAIDNAQTQLSYTTITSPLTGKTGFRLIDPGNIIHATDQTGVVTIVKLQPISVVFTAPEENVGQINKALAAGTVPVIALSSDSTKTLGEGHLALVDNQVDQTSGTIHMKATFQNKDDALWPGLSVATRLLVDTRKNVPVIANDGIQHGPNGLYAFVVGADNKVEKRDIEVGDEGTTQSVVRKGLASGDRVVTSGQYRLTEGALVTPRTANALPPPDKEAANSSQKEP